ncbi:hypothetical protein BMJ22_14860 [Sinorhizobium medicae]|nr:hypothetical protein BMJ22_14860 [Sinorhizobium medicae]
MVNSSKRCTSSRRASRRFAHGAWLGCEFSATIQTGKMYSQLIEAMHLLPQSFDMWATFLLPGSSLTRSAPLLLPGC